MVIAGAGAHVVLLDSELTGGDPSKPAVDMPQVGHLFARNVGVSGYGVAVRKAGNTAVPGGYVGEYVSDRVYKFDAGQSPRSLNLAVEGPPPTPWPADFSRWASVDDFGARGDGTADDAAAIQRAFDSGAEVVYFPKQLYRVESVVDVPATVRRVAFLFGSVTGSPGASFLRVGENSAVPLVVEDVNRVEGAVLVDHAQPRTLVLDTVGSSGLYRNNSTGENGDVFFNNVNGLKGGTGTIRNQRAWARWTNTEYKGGPNFGVAAGGTFWVLGYKVEGGTINFDVQPGGTLEVLGGLANQYGADTFNDGASPDIVYRVDNGRVSAVSASNGPDIDPARNNAFITVVENTRNDVTKTVEWTELPAREGRRHQWVLPLYVG